jgi:hypothetical protein
MSACADAALVARCLMFKSGFFDNHARRQRWRTAGVPRHGGSSDVSTHDPRIARRVSRSPSLRSLGLAQFLTGKLYGHQRGNDAGGDHGGSTNLLA